MYVFCKNCYFKNRSKKYTYIYIDCVKHANAVYHHPITSKYI